MAKRLILDELFDLSLYQRLQNTSDPGLHKALSELIAVERNHFAFWQDFFRLKLNKLNLLRRLKLQLIVFICRIFGPPAIDLVLEAIEVYGIRKYLNVWKRYKDEALGTAVRGILQDEFQHEDEVVTRLKERIINPDRVRNIFLGVNDGMVEILGAVSGFFASFGRTSLVLVAGLTTAVAGALSMAAGAFVATSSESEVRRTQDEKAVFLGGSKGMSSHSERPGITGVIVGISYFIGASFPLIPVLFGAKNALLSILTGGSMILLVSVTVAFLSGMEIKRRALMNLVLIALAVGVTYIIGVLVRTLVGIQI
jgi:predicted membrane protein (TIGR00267 family)